MHLLPNYTDDSNALAIALPISLLVVVAIAGILFFYFWRRKKREQSERNTDIINAKFKVVENPRYVTPNNSSDEEEDESQLCTALGHLAEEVERRNLEISRDCIRMTKVTLGRGNFGEVKQVIVRKSDETEMLCAAKMARGANSYVSLQDMLDELEIHLKLEANHENVVNLIGVCSGNDGPFYLIMEYCGNGSLIDYLRKHADIPVYVNLENRRALSLEWKLSCLLEICNGMKYLASHKIVHRDLAARNVLLDSNTVAKVSDFGMAKDVYLKSYYKQRREGSFPLRWMAIDAIQTFEFTEKTDVWSFGVLVWEIFTDGKLPYYDIIDDQKVAHYILNGKKLKRPEKCPKFLYNEMLKCWSNKSYNRPLFWELYNTLDASIHPAKHRNPLKRRVSRSMLNAFSQTKSSLKRKISRKGSVKSKGSAGSAGRRRGSRKHSQSSFDRIINDFEIQRLQENLKGINNEGLDEETEAEINFSSKKKGQDENQSANDGLKDHENDLHLETSPPLGRKKTGNLGRSSSTKPKITSNDGASSEGQKNQGNANSSNIEVSKKVLPDGANNYAAVGAILNAATKNKNELSTERPQTADSTAKYGSYQETTDLDDPADDTRETADDILATVAENVPGTLVDDRTYSGKLNNNCSPEKELNPNTDSACGKTFDNSTNLTTDLDNNWSDEMGETSTAAKDTNVSSQNGIYPESRNNGLSPTNQGEGKADFTENGEENEKGSYDGIDMEKSFDKVGSKDGQQKSSDGTDFLSDVLSAVNYFKDDDNDMAQTKNEIEKKKNPNSSSS